MNSAQTLFHSEKLINEIQKIPFAKRFFKKDENAFNDFFSNNSCVFGMQTTVNFETLKYIPSNTKGFYFYFGNAIKDLLREITKLNMKNIEFLTIGITHANDIRDYFSDYSEITEILSNTYFPNLKVFEYGIDELVVNEQCIYGNLGNITQLLANMPKLEKLYLYGNFELSKYLNFNYLTDLEILMNDPSININGGKISNSTIQNLFSSNFSELNLLSAYLNFNDEKFEYSLPDIFLTGSNISKLKNLSLQGNFVKGTKDRVIKSDFLNKHLENFEFKNLKEPIHQP